MAKVDLRYTQGGQGAGMAPWAWLGRGVRIQTETYGFARQKTHSGSRGSGSVRTKNGGKGKTMATHLGKEALLQ